MRNVVIVGNTLVVILVLMMVAILPVNTVEVSPEVSFIKMLPADANPYQKLYDEMLYPTVKITTQQGVGSGVVIQSSKVQEVKGSKEHVNIYVLTAAHVVGNQSAVTITIYTPLTPLVRGDFNATVVITDTNKDLALLKLNPSNPRNLRLYTAKLAPHDYTYYLFTSVYAIGCSLGLNPRPSSGIISAIHLSGLGVYPEFNRRVSAVEISAPILPGNSGGPVYSADTHEFIGIAVWVKVYHGQLVTTMAGIVPIQTIYEFLDIATKTPSH